MRRVNQGTSGTEWERQSARSAAWGSLAACLVAAGLAPSAMADVIWDQSWDGVSNSFVASQDFEAAYDGYDVQALMDFSTSATWSLETAVSIGYVHGTAAPSAAVVAQIWDDLPLNGGSVILTSVAGMETISGVDTFGGVTLEADFGGQVLAPGDYYFSIFVVRDIAVGGQFHLHTTTNGNGVADWLYNPGGDFGFIQETIGDVGFQPPEANFVLNGTIVPGPAAGLVALAGIPWLLRRRTA